MTSSLEQNPSSSKKTFAKFITLIGFLWGFFVIFFVIILPFVWSPALKWNIYRQIYTGLWMGAILSPFLIVGGVASQHSSSFADIFSLLRKTLGYEMLLIGIYWFLQNIFQATQLGWSALRIGPQFILQNYGIMWGGVVWTPALIALGYALITQTKIRYRIGILLTTLGYQSLLFLGLFRLFLSLAPKFVPLLAPLPSKEHIMIIGLSFALAPLPLFFLGFLFIANKKFLLRLHLMLSFPLWIPLFIIFFFWSLVVDTTFYFLEELFKKQLNPSPLTKVLLAPLCLLFFPLLLTIDFSIGLINLLGHHVLRQLFLSQSYSKKEEIQISSTYSYGIGTILLLTLPIWAIPVILYGAIRLFVYESILMHLIGHKAFENSNDL